jgi:hypothetical protein
MDEDVSFRDDDFTLVYGLDGQARSKHGPDRKLLAKRLITLIGCFKICANLWGGVPEQMPLSNYWPGKDFRLLLY